MNNSTLYGLGDTMGMSMTMNSMGETTDIRKSAFQFQDRDEAVDLNQFSDVDLYKITHEHDLEYLLSFLKGVGFGRVDEEQLKAIADPRVVTAFEIAQLLIEYLLYTEQKFKRKCNEYKERLRRKDGELRELKRQYDNQNVEVQQYKLRINKNKEIVATFESLLRQTPPVITGRAWSCSVCHKAFIMKEYLNKHIQTYHNGEAESEEVVAESKSEEVPKKKAVKKVVKKVAKKAVKKAVKAAKPVQEEEQQPEIESQPEEQETQPEEEQPEEEPVVQEEEPEPVEEAPEPTEEAPTEEEKPKPKPKKAPAKKAPVKKAAKKPSPKKASPKKNVEEAPEIEPEPLEEEPAPEEEEVPIEEGDENKPSANEENVPERENEVEGDNNEVKPDEGNENVPSENVNDDEAKPENENVAAPEEAVPVEEKPKEEEEEKPKEEEEEKPQLVKAETKLPKKPYVPPTEEERKTFGVARTLTSTLPRAGTKLTSGLPFDVIAEDIPDEFKGEFNSYTVYIDTTTPICDAISDIYIALHIKSTPKSHPKYFSLFAKETNGNVTPLKTLSAAKDTVLYTGDVENLILKYTPDVDVMKEKGNDLNYVQNYIDSILCYDQDVVKLEQEAAVDSDIDEDVLDDSLKPQDVNPQDKQQTELRKSTKQTMLRPKTAKTKKSLRPLTGEPNRTNIDGVKIPTYQDPAVKEDIRKSLRNTLQNLNLDNLSVGSLEDDVMNPDNYLDVEDNENLDSVVDSELDSIYA